MNGSLGKQAEKVKAFTERLSEHTNVPIEYRDERLTTVLAKRLARVATKKTRGKTRRDAQAAAIILQGYLDEGRELNLP